MYSLETFLSGLDRYLDEHPDLAQFYVNSIDGTRHGVLITFVGDNRKIEMEIKNELQAPK